MANSNEENAEDTRQKSTDSFSNKVILISLFAIAAMLIGNFLVSIVSPEEKRIMAPGPLGSTDSISEPVG